ncbi:MAG: hypothetical protein JO086_12850 [Acidimicrobiia bacterium]|nr:hypothetical protein [Acidimicrobiia bacterium]
MGAAMAAAPTTLVAPAPARRISLKRFRRRPSTATAITGVVIFLSCLYIFWQLRPDLLFRETLPAGGDMGAHVWGPNYLRHHLLTHGRITGWTPDWYAGFPFLTFYFPLPSLLIALSSFVIPYDIAFKLVSVSGLLALPVAAYLFGRLSGVRFPGPALLGVAMVPFVFDRAWTIYGGNIASTLAGEFSFTISLCFGLVFLGMLARGLDTGKGRALTAALLAATALSHVLPTVFVLVGAVVFYLVGPLRGPRGRARLKYMATVMPVGGLLAGFWAVTVLFRTPYATDMGWEKLTQYTDNLFGKPPLWVLLLAGVGALSSIIYARRTGIAVLALGAVFAGIFRFEPQARLWNARWLPFWYLCLYLLAALAVAELAAAIGTLLARDPDRPWRVPGLIAPALAAIAALVVTGIPLRNQASANHSLGLWSLIPLPSSKDQSFIPSWVAWNYTGYEGKPAWPEYHSVVQTMSKLPCGRAHWEYESNLDRYGTPMALMLLPYWTNGCIDSMEGLYFESSATTPYHFLNAALLSKAPSNPERDLPYKSLDVASGVKHLQLMGVRYYMAFSQDALAQAHADPDLRLVATSKPWEIFEVANSEIATGLKDQPAVVKNAPKGGAAWMNLGVNWYDQDPSTWDVPIAATGPSGWQRISVTSDPGSLQRNGTAKVVGTGLQIQPPLRIPVRQATVSHIKMSDDSISFDVDKPGSPMLVKASYFPNWQASGAKGPYRVAPNQMVVVPTSRHVTLHYGYTVADRLGYALTLLGIVAFIALARRGPMPMPPGDDGGEQLSLFDDPLDFWGDGPSAAGNGELLLPRPG